MCYWRKVILIPSKWDNCLKLNFSMTSKFLPFFELKAGIARSWLAQKETNHSIEYFIDNYTQTTLVVGEDLWKAFSQDTRLDFLEKAKEENIAIKIGSIFNYTKI